MTQLKKLAQGYQSQEGTGAGDLGDIDEDDEVPGRNVSNDCGDKLKILVTCRFGWKL